MKKQWQELAQKIDARSLRERGMVFAIVVAALVASFATFVLNPRMVEQRQVSQQLSRDRNTAATFQAENQRMAKVPLIDPDAEDKARLQKLQAESAHVEDAILNMRNGLVPPEKMSTLLQGILNQNGKLHLVSLKTLPVSSLNEAIVPKAGETRNAAVPGKANAQAAQKATEESLYRHGVEIVVQGSYFELMQYLAQLEKMPWQLIWGKANLRVVEHPVATLTLEVYTLSLEKKWLNL